MEILKGTDFKIENSAVSLGKFDGIHLGHRLLLNEILKQKELTPTVFTFGIDYTESEKTQGKFIYSWKEKQMVLKDIGIKRTVLFPFNEETKNMEPEDFIEKFLIEKMDARFICVGTDFCFGKDRRGNAGMLKSFAARYGYKVKIFNKMSSEDGVISSTLIRKKIEEGDIKSANKLLGRTYFIEGTVVHGNALGRRLDMPTANIFPWEGKVLLPPGVYATTLVMDGRRYPSVTILELLLLVAGRMPFFDALTTTMGTAGTGGFGIKNDSMMGYSAYIQWIVTIFMILFGVNFNAYYLILFHHFKKAFSIEEVRCYLGIIAAAVAIIFFQVLRVYGSAFDALTHAAFQVASIITTTGYSTTDFDLWSQASKTVLVLLMFIGACAGSTGGGIKVSRFVILVKTLGKELTSYIHPKSIKKIKVEGKPVEHEVVRSTNVYFITFMIIFSASVLAVSFEGKDLITNFTAVAATINNIGPGLEMVGPTQNFGLFTPFSKYVLMFDMLAGRLELFPLLILFHPVIWKDLFTQKIIYRKGA